MQRRFNLLLGAEVIANLLLVSLLGLWLAMRSSAKPDEINSDVFFQQISSYEWCHIVEGPRSVDIKRVVFDEQFVHLKELIGTATLNSTQKKLDSPNVVIQFYRRSEDLKPALLGSLGLWNVAPRPLGCITVEWDDRGLVASVDQEGASKYCAYVKSVVDNLDK
jgi:hypothetical protein